MFVQTIHDDDRNRAIVEAIINGEPIQPGHGNWDVEDLVRVAAIGAFVGMFQVPRQSGPDAFATFMDYDKDENYMSTDAYFRNFHQAFNDHLKHMSNAKELPGQLLEAFMRNGWRDQ